MDMQSSIPQQYHQSFINAGWYKNRKIDISDYIFELEYMGYDYLKKISCLFTEFGNLTIMNPFHNNKIYSVTGIRFSLKDLCYNKRYLEDYSEASNEILMPLASGISNVHFLFGSRGGYFGFYDHYLWKFGNTFSEFIIAVFEGENWHRIQLS